MAESCVTENHYRYRKNADADDSIHVPPILEPERELYHCRLMGRGMKDEGSLEKGKASKDQNVEETQGMAELLCNNHKGVSRSTPGACKLLIPLEQSELALADNMLCLEKTRVPNYYRKRSSDGRCGPAYRRVRTYATGTCPS